MKIKIYKRNFLGKSHSIYMDDENKKDVIVVDADKEASYRTNLFKFELLNTVSDWPKELIDEKILDGIEYEIVIKDDNKTTSYKFTNKFPDDIYKLEIIINRIVESAYVKTV